MSFPTTAQLGGTDQELLFTLPALLSGGSASDTLRVPVYGTWRSVNADPVGKGFLNCGGCVSSRAGLGRYRSPEPPTDPKLVGERLKSTKLWTSFSEMSTMPLSGAVKFSNPASRSFFGGIGGRGCLFFYVTFSRWIVSSLCPCETMSIRLGGWVRLK